MQLEDTLALVRWVRGLPPAERRARNLALLGNAPLIDLEVASACNAVCTFCPRQEMAREAGRMSEETFAAVEALLPEDAIVMVSGLGEGILHPSLPAWIARLRARGVSSSVITNGIALTPARQAALVNSGIDQIQVSVHGVEEQTVRGVMPRGAPVDVVRAHLEHLARTMPRRLRVRLNFVETSTNGHASAEVEALARELGFDFFYRREHARGGALDGGRAAGTDEGCGIFASVTFISADGDVLPCVNDVRGEGRLGNVRALDWATVLDWKRQVITSGQWFAPCGGCDDDYRWVLTGQGGL